MLIYCIVKFTAESPNKQKKEVTAWGQEDYWW
jgi:hypothetical protein